MNAVTENFDPLDELLAGYLRALEKGETPCRDELLARHPELANELREFFANHDRVARMTRPLCEGGMFDGPFEQIRYFGDYELLEEIARGGMGIVYRARQVRLNRQVAIKMILLGPLATEADVRRLHTEAQAAANLQHPRIVAVHEVGEHAGHHYFSMDYVEGRNLAAIVRENPLPPRRAADYVQQAAEAIHYAHQQGTLHRDLKPSNILIDRTDQVRITDFGLAMLVAGGSDLTRTGQVLGTPSYMSPEQAQGKRGLVGPGSDVYALGAILYELLTGRPPFRADSAVETIQQAIAADPVSPCLLNPKIGRDLETIALKCLEKEPYQRYPTAQHLADDLGRYLRGEPIAARPVGTIGRLARWCRRKPATVAALGASSIALFAILIGGLIWNETVRVRQAYREADEARQTSEKFRTELQRALDVAQRARATEAELREKVESALADLGDAHATTARDKDRVEGALARSEQFSYMMRLASADRAWQGNELVAAEELLEQCPPHLRCWEWHYLKHLCHAELMSLPGLENAPLAVALSPDGPRAFAVDARGMVRRWDTSTGADLGSFDTSDGLGGVTCATMSPDRQRLAVGNWKGSVTLWQTSDGARLETIAQHQTAVTCIAFSRDGTSVASACQGGSVAVRHFTTGASSSFAVVDPDQRVRFVAFSPDAGLLLVGVARPIASPGIELEARRPTLWDIATGARVDRPVENPGSVTDAAFSPDGAWLAMAQDDGRICLQSWNGTWSRPQVFVGHSRAVRRLAFTGGGTHLVSCGDDRMLRIWNVETQKEVRTIRGHTSPPDLLDADDGGTRIIAVDGSRQVKIWDARSDQLWREVPRVVGTKLIGIGFRHDDRRIAVVAYSGILATFDVRTRECLGRFQQAGRSLAYSPVDGTLITRSSDLAIWKDGMDPPIRTPSALSPGNCRVAISRDGKRFATGIAGPEVGIFDSATGRLLQSLKIDAGKLNPIDFSFGPDDRLLAVAFTPIQPNTEGQRKTSLIQLWSLPEGELVRTIEGFERQISNIALSPDGRRLATAGGSFPGGAPGELRIWDVDSGALLHDLRGHSRCVYSVDFSPDGRRLVAAGGQWPNSRDPGELKIWDVTYGQLIRDLPGHPQAVMSAKFSHDGRCIASAGDDGSVRLWGQVP